MKGILSKIIFILAAALLLAACDSAKDDFPVNPPTVGSNSVVIDITAGAEGRSRAEAVDVEVAVEHIDVLIFNRADEKLFWHERVTNCNDREGTITLGVKRSAFEKDAEYWVYLIANSTYSAAQFSSLSSLPQLKTIMQNDENIHLTGSPDVAEAPKLFLMDGVAFLKDKDTVEEPLMPGTVVLYNGVRTDDTRLKVVLRRAAAKIIVKIRKGDDVTFDNTPAANGAGYYLRNMPYSVSLLAGVTEKTDKLRTPGKIAGHYFDWTAGQITVTAYAYPHRWMNESVLDQEVSMVVNIPLTYKDEENVRANCYYQIPVSKMKTLKRNTCYEVSVVINAPGAEEPSEPILLDEIDYKVFDWTEVGIDIGGDEMHPTFLYVNKEEMEMWNVEDDEKTLIFASSSAVSTRVTKVYYTDKFGQVQDITDGVSLSATGISVTPDPMLTGHIKIHSPMPTNNTIRYIEIEVSNEDGIVRRVLVAQHPLVEISNMQCWYSYRDDFGGTTYEHLNGVYVIDQTFTSATAPVANNGWICACRWENGRWVYSTSDKQNNFFASLVRESDKDGVYSTLKYYTWSQQGGGNNITYSHIHSGGPLTGKNNVRVYHIRISATSDEYTLGRPRITDGKTDSGRDNAQLVSPSFMIASQLGTVRLPNNATVEMCADHCKQYVEVLQNEATGETVHYRGWRLPTEAEIGVIEKFQNMPGSAMDQVLKGGQYYCASGIVNVQGQHKDLELRCIRDVYDENE